MGKTTTRIIIVLAAVFVLIAVYQTAQENGTDPAGFRAQLLLPDLDLAAVAAVQLDDGAATLTLRRTEGDHWGVEQRAGYPVDGEKLRRLVLGITQLKARDRLTDNPDKYGTLGLGDPPEGGTVTLRDADGNTLAVLRLGRQKPATGPGGAAGRFVRVGDDPAVYLVAGAPAADTGTTGWLDRKLLDLPADQMVAVSVTRETGSFAASRQQPADPLTLQTPLPPGRTADSGALGDLGRALVNLTCDDVLPEGDPTVADLVFGITFTAHSADGVEYTVTLATRDDAHFARLEAAGQPQDSTAAESATDGAGDPPKSTAAQEAQPDPAAIAKKFNDRHRGWTYMMPKYTYDRLDKTLDDLLTDQEK